MSKETGDEVVASYSLHVRSNGSGGRGSNDSTNSQTEQLDRERDAVTGERSNTNKEDDSSTEASAKYNNGTHGDNVPYEEKEEVAQLHVTSAANVALGTHENTMAATSSPSTSPVRTTAEEMDSLTAPPVDLRVHPTQASMIRSTFSPHLSNDTSTTAGSSIPQVSVDSSAAPLLQGTVPPLTAAGAAGVKATLDLASSSGSDTRGKSTEVRSATHENVSRASSQTNAHTNSNPSGGNSVTRGHSQPENAYPVFTQRKPCSSSDDSSGLGRMERDDNPSNPPARDGACSTGPRPCDLSFDGSSPPSPLPAPNPSGDVEVETAESTTVLNAAAHDDSVLSGSSDPKAPIGISETFGTVREIVYSTASQNSTTNVFEFTERPDQMDGTTSVKKVEEGLPHGGLEKTTTAALADDDTCELQKKKHNKDKQTLEDLVQPYHPTLVSFDSATKRADYESPATDTPKNQSSSASGTAPLGQSITVGEKNAAFLASNLMPGSLTSDSTPRPPHTATLNDADPPLLNSSRTQSSGDGDPDGEKVITASLQTSHLHQISDGSGNTNKSVDDDKTLLQPKRENHGMEDAADQNEGVGDQGEDDEFGEFVEATSSRAAADEIPIAVAAIPFHHSSEQQHELYMLHGREEEGNSMETSHFSAACAAADEGVCEMWTETVRSDENAPVRTKPLPNEVMNVCPEEYAIVKNDEDPDEDEWAAFTEAPPSFYVPSGVVASTERGLNDNNVSGPMVLQAWTGDDLFVFDRDVDRALLRQRLSELANCVMESDRNTTGSSNMESVCNNFSSSLGDNNVQVTPSRSELLRSTMEALSFTRRAQHGAPEEFIGVRGSCSTSDNFSISCTLLGTYSTLTDVCDTTDHSQQHQQRHVAAPIAVDPVAALQIADRRSIRSRENLTSLLLGTSQRQQAIPVETVIAKVRSIDEDEVLQSEVSNDVTYRIHFTLPPPQIGGIVYPAPSLQLPI